ncbi:VOC family protein [Streptomyces sp. WAC00469]|uniref:VOC family protein n=1 Tax=Streptomyces sp. WAC00469 TaxID=2487415 RepID=UPI0037DC7C8B
MSPGRCCLTPRRRTSSPRPSITFLRRKTIRPGFLIRRSSTFLQASLGQCGVAPTDVASRGPPVPLGTPPGLRRPPGAPTPLRASRVPRRTGPAGREHREAGPAAAHTGSAPLPRRDARPAGPAPPPHHLSCRRHDVHRTHRSGGARCAGGGTTRVRPVRCTPSVPPPPGPRMGRGSGPASWAGCPPTTRTTASRSVPPDAAGFRLRFPPSQEPKTGRNRAHVDPTSTSWEDRRQTVARALELGARHIGIGQLPEEPHGVLADPDGNEFAVRRRR